MIASSNKSDNLAEQVDFAEVGLVREFLEFLRFNKKWWLTPIVAVLMLVGILVAVGGSAAAPLIYTIW